MPPRSAAHTIGRYALFDEIASGGMATVHVGRLLGPVGFSRTVAIKRLHPQFAKDPEFVAMFLDEARLAARIRHPNVVPTIDVVATEGELFLVMEYVHGDSLSRLSRAVRAAGARIPPRVGMAAVVGILHGLHAAHEAQNERGEPLDIVHRDVSPHNVLLGVDGVARLLDFGVAKAVGRAHTTRDGKIKGKLAYMAPEQLQGKVTRRTDIYAAGVVLWEVLVGRRLFSADSEGELMSKVLSAPIDAPSEVNDEAPRALDAVVFRALQRDPSARFETAREMALSIERAAGPGGVATSTEVGEWVEGAARDVLALRNGLVREIEETSSSNVAPAPAASSEEPTRQYRKPGEDVSSISLSRQEVEAQRSKRWKILGATGAFVAAAAAIVVLIARVQKENPKADPMNAAASAPTTPASTPSPTPSVTKSEPSAPPSTSTTDAPNVAPSLSFVAPTSTVKPTAHPPAATPTTKPGILGTSKATSAPPTGPACDPPFTFVNGVKTYKPECFTKK